MNLSQTLCKLQRTQATTRSFKGIHRFKKTLRCMRGSQGKGVQTRKYEDPL